MSSSHSLRGNLFPASDGLLYGSENQIFTVTLQGDVTVLQTVQGLNDLIEAANGSLYGIYNTGQTYPTYPPYQFFQMSLAGVVTPLYAGFATPPLQGQITQAPDGNFYGVQIVSSGSGFVQIFKLTPGGAFSVLVDSHAATDGLYPNGLLVDEGNFLFGTTTTGGSTEGSFPPYGYGVIFRVDLQGNYKVLHTFENGTDGRYPGPLLVGGDGYLYGQSTLPSGAAQIFRIRPDGTEFSPVFQYPDNVGGGLLTQGSDGKFYGVSMSDNINFLGSIFKVDLGLAPPPPRVSAFRPSSGSEGTKVLIRGTQLLGVTSVKFNGVAAATIASKGPYYVVAEVPPGATTGPITITTPNGTFRTTQIFTVRSAFGSQNLQVR